MNAVQMQEPSASSSNLVNLIRSLSLFPVRIEIGRFLIALCFLLPFFNYHLIDPDYAMEANFLPVLLAAVILPEIMLREVWSLLLLLPVFAVALFGATPTAFMRVGIGVIPLLFVLNLTCHLREQRRGLLYPGLAYRALQVFVLVCFAQTAHIIPNGITQTLVAIVPRYSADAFVNTDVRGVQGWASEPSSAGVTCMAFALVSIVEQPERRWRVLALFSALLVLNRSVYATLLAIMLAIGCLLTLKRKRYALLSTVPLSMAALTYIRRSGRLSEMNDNVQTYGVNTEFNKEFVRFSQILSPFQQFPHVYKPPVLFGTLVEWPLGLLPLMVGFGSVLGIIWLLYIQRQNFPLRKLSLRPLAFVSAFVLLIMASPDQVPPIVALSVFLVPRTRQPVRFEGSTNSSTKSAISGAGGAE